MATTLATAFSTWLSRTWMPQADEALPFLSLAAFWIALIVAVVAVMAAISSKMRAGRPAGRRIRKIAETLLPPGTYRHLHDVTFETREGVVHIDHIVISPFGIFVIEAMEKRGEISGKAFDPDWTQTARGETIPFPNPLKPNFNRKLALGALLGIAQDRLFSVIAFTEEATFRFAMPDNVTRGKGLADYIRSRDAALIADGDIPAIMDRIRAAMTEKPAGAAPRPGTKSPSRLRYMNVLKFAAMAAALAGGGHVLHNTAQFPDIPSRWNPVTWFTGETTPSKIEITRTEPARRVKPPRSDAYGILTIKAGKDTRLTLADRQSGSAILVLDLKAGESRDIEIRKGHYRAQIEQDGRMRVRVVSFIGASGTLEL